MFNQAATAIQIYVPLPKLNSMKKRPQNTPCGPVYKMSALIVMTKMI